jgi:hypothetical protein
MPNKTVLKQLIINERCRRDDNIDKYEMYLQELQNNNQMLTQQWNDIRLMSIVQLLGD